MTDIFNSSCMRVVARVCLVYGIAMALGVCEKVSAQSAGSGNDVKPHAPNQQVTVSANLSPAELEDEKINEDYQPAFQLKMQEKCTEAIEKYNTVVIPRAEKAKYEKPRGKYLFLAYDDIGECDLRTSKFAEAEAAFEKARVHADTWPTKEDSSYAALFVTIGMAREYQGNWKGGQESLETAMALTQGYIDKRSAKSGDELAMEESNHMRKSQDTVMELLAAAYFRQGHKDEAF